jgi:large subunit ribosomal protein L9
MKVILLENVRKVGSIGEIIDVKRGFARNYLISKKKALFASPQNIKEVEKIKQDLSKKDEERKKEAKVINEKIKNKQYEIKKLSTENKELYGSIKPTEISKVLEEKEQVKVNPSLIQPSKEIKSLGNFDVLINLHPEVQTQIVIKAVAQEEAK